MIEAVVYITLGIFVGWNLPQPSWAKSVQDKVVKFFKNVADVKK